MGQEDERLAVNFFEKKRAASQHLRERPLDDLRRHFQELHGRSLQFLKWQCAMTFGSRPQQNVIYPGTRPVLRVLGYPDALSDLIGGGESDAVYFLRQSVRVLLHGLDGQVPVGLEDADRSPGTDSVAM